MARRTGPEVGPAGMPDLQWLEGGITTVPGILASGMAAGIKPSGKKDLALIYSSAPARAAAVFTQNQVKGAPVVVSQEHVRGGVAQAIVASSGCANVCTGQQGLDELQQGRSLIVTVRGEAQTVLQSLAGITAVEALGGEGECRRYRLHAAPDTAPNVANALAQAGIALYELTTERRDLETVFAQVNEEVAHA